MKIALTSRHYNKRGGISRYVANLAEILVRNNKIHVFSMDWCDVGDNRINFHRVPAISKTFTWEIATYALINSTIFKLKKFDIIHSNGADSFSQDIITAHSIHKAWLDYLVKEEGWRGFGTIDRIVLAVEKYNYTKRKYKKIISDSSSAKKELMEYYSVPEEDIEVIPLSVDLDEFKPISNDELVEYKQKYGIVESDFVLTTVATEFGRKGVYELIEALGLLKKIREDIKLLIVGEGKEGLDKYLRLIEKLDLNDKVIFTDQVTGHDLTRHYNLSDIFVLPTKYEAFGLPVVEAMATELPVVVSKIGAGELITEGYDGLLLENPRNPSEIAEKINVLLDDDSLRKKLGKNARKKAKAYSRESVAEKTMNVYKEVLGL